MELRVTIGLLLVIAALLLYGFHYFRMQTRTRKQKEEILPASDFIPLVVKTEEVIGQTNRVFLVPLSEQQDEKPDMSVSVEMEPACETESAVTTEDVEVNLYAEDRFDESDMTIPCGVDSSGELSQGLTFEQISQALEVVKGEKNEEDEQVKAGETLSLMTDEMLEVITMHENNAFIVNKLISLYVDHPNKRKPKTIEGFDIDKYV